jgi:hypothetical protein
MGSRSHVAPQHTYIVRGIKGARFFVKAVSNTSFLALGDEICAGILTRRMGRTK